MASLTCPRCQKPMVFAPSRSTFQSQSSIAEAVTGKIDLACSDAKCKGRGTADIDEMRRQAEEADRVGNRAAARAIRDEVKRIGF